MNPADSRDELPCGFVYRVSPWNNPAFCGQRESEWPHFEGADGHHVYEPHERRTGTERRAATPVKAIEAEVWTNVPGHGDKQFLAGSARPANETTGEPPRPNCSDCSCCTAAKVFGVCLACSMDQLCDVDECPDYLSAPSTPAGDGLRARHHEHVHRDGCHRWFDHAADELLDLAGPTGWCEGCGEDWPCDTTRALNRLALASQPRSEDGLREALAKFHAPKKTWDSGNPLAVDGWVTWCDGCGEKPYPCRTMRIAAEYAAQSGEAAGEGR